MEKNSINIKLTIQYDGSVYNGSQIQPDKITVHQVLLDALKKLNISTKLNFSGRTDKDVHATGQVVSCLIPSFWNNIDKLKQTLNRLTPNSIFIKKIEKVDIDFHARFSAKKREYRYIISTKPTNVFNTNYVTYYKDIDETLIKKAIKYIVGIHDFEYFSKSGSEPNSTTREIYDIKFYRYKEYYVLKFCANSYLRSQIRMLTNFLLKISSKTLTIDNLIDQLNKKKKISSTLAPASGLYLSKIKY